MDFFRIKIRQFTFVVVDFWHENVNLPRKKSANLFFIETGDLVAVKNAYGTHGQTDGYIHQHKIINAVSSKPSLPRTSACPGLSEKKGKFYFFSR